MVGFGVQNLGLLIPIACLAFFKSLGLDQNYLERTADGSRRTKNLTVRTIITVFGSNYGHFVIYHCDYAKGTQLNTISTPGALIEVYFRY